MCGFLHIEFWFVQTTTLNVGPDIHLQGRYAATVLSKCKTNVLVCGSDFSQKQKSGKKEKKKKNHKILSFYIHQVPVTELRSVG